MLWRGAFLLLIGQILSLLSGYGIQVFLARSLAPERYGTFGIVQSILMILELSVIAGVPNALKRFVGERPEAGYALHKILFKWQLWLAAALFTISFLLAPAISVALHDPEISLILRWAVIDILLFGLYWYANGFLIGQKKFAQQTVMVAAYTISKFVLVVALVQAGFGLIGAFVANFLASGIGMLAGVFMLKLEKTEAEVTASQQFGFIVPSILYSVGLNLFFYIDLWFVKYHVAGAAVGYYTVAGNLARIPYFFSAAITGSLLPTLSYAVGRSDAAETRRIIRQSARGVMLLLFPAAAVVASEAGMIVTVLFGSTYLPAAGALKILFPAISILTLFAVLNTINIARSGMLLCGAMVLLMVAADCALNALLVPAHGMQGAALATAMTMLVAVLLSGLLLYQQYRFFLGFKSIVRLAAISGLLFVAGSTVQTQSVLAEGAELAGLALLYGLLLRVTGEINAGEVRRFKARGLALLGWS